MLFFSFFLSLLSLLLGISSVRADLSDANAPTPAVVDSIKNVQKEVADLASAVEHWSGHIVETFNITAASKSIVKSINEGIETAEKQKKMTVGQAIKVKKVTKDLVGQIESTVDTLIRNKLLFSHAGINDIMINKIEKQKEQAAKLIDTIVGKLPKVGKKTGRKLGRQINAAFDVAIAAFHKLP